jgi:nucleoside-diphosphate-sugar epimerase
LIDLITGGAGFIGSHLADALVARGDDVVILDDLSTGRRENIEHLLTTGQAELVEGSASDLALVDGLMSQADRCFHLASAVGVQLVCDHPLGTLLRNARGCDVVLGAAARHDVRLLFTSTSEIYGKNSDGALREDADRLLGTPSKGRWSYANAKAFGEMLAYGYHREQGAEMTVVRLFNTVGPRQTGAYGMVLPRFARQALTGEDITVFGDGSQSRCFSHVDDVVDGILRLIDREAAMGNPYNVGSSREITILELAERVAERAESTSAIRFVPFDQAYDDGFEELGRRKADTTAIRELTGWAPLRTIEEAIDDVLAFQRQLLQVRELDLA